MQGLEFPLYKTRRQNVDGKFNLNEPSDRRRYFEAKLGPQIERIKEFLQKGTFVAIMLGKKNSGKGTYSKLFMEIFGKEHIGHLSVGDVVRDVHEILETGQGREELMNFVKSNYRGFHSEAELTDMILGRGTTTLLSSELILVLMKYEISKRPRQAVFIDGFPRALDQVSYAMFLREIIGYREDTDMLVFLDVPESVIDERIKYRVICPVCKTPRSTRLLATSLAGYDEARGEFYLMCDNAGCNKARMVSKEGDELGIEPIRSRLVLDDQIFKQLLELKGISKVQLRNSVPVTQAAEFVDDYELTPGYSYERTPSGEVKIVESPWTVKDDNGIESYSLLPAAVVCGLIDQLDKILSG